MRITGGGSESLFTPEEMEEYIKRGAVKRKQTADYQMELQRAVDAAQMARRERAEVGATRRQGMIEAGELEQQRRTQLFTGPQERALTEGAEAEAAASRLKVGRIRREEGLIPRIVPGETPRATNIPEPEPEAAAPTTAPAGATRAVAKPAERKLRPWIEKGLYGQESSTPYYTPFGKRTRIPGILDIYRGYTNIGEWLKHLGKEAYEYAYPRR